MQSEISAYFLPALFLGVVLYGVLQYAVTPFAVQRSYRKLGFTDRGKSLLDEPPVRSSIVLATLNTDHLYSGVFNGHQLQQCLAHPETRHKFTMSRVRRKRNQARFTVTTLYSEQRLPSFCARPTTVTDAMEYMLDNRNMVFPEDQNFANRQHVIADDSQAVRRCLTPLVRKHLTGSAAVSLECIEYSVNGQSTGGSTLIMKRPREAFDPGDKLLEQLEIVIEIYRELATNC